LDTILKLANRSASTRYTERYARILLSMSLEEAKTTLGLRSSSPTKEEITKAYRAKALENHPDRGGDPEKMVEVNVARDILEGKARPGRPTAPSKKEEDPEEVKRRKAEIKKRSNIAATESDMEKASRVMSQALNGLSVVDANWRGDFKSYLNDDYADTVDRIHDEAVASESKAPAMAKAERIAKNLASTALRIASKFGSLKKRVIAVRSEPTVESISALYGEILKFAKALHAHRKESGDLATLIVTNDVVPITWDDLYSDAHQMLIAYDTDFGKFTDSVVKSLEDQVEMSVDATVMRLEREYSIDGKFPDWKKWRIPADFHDAIELINKAG
jgi:curved DNA-binding protein CbpA